MSADDGNMNNNNNIVSMDIDSVIIPPSTTAKMTVRTINTSSTADGTPWVERYRPQTLDDVSHQTEVVSVLKNAVASGRLPHLLLYGPPGSGKTSVALALCKQLWHPSQWRRRVLELNASDERGISVVREKIKQFASLSVGTGLVGVHSSSNSNTNNNTTTSNAGSRSKKTSNTATSFFGGGKKGSNNEKENTTTMDVTTEDNHEEHDEEEKKYPNPPFKIIILDEADTVTPDAQAALRRIIEAHSRITRFILICNYVTRIIEPLASRCAKFRFQPLPPSSMKERLICIAQAEGMMSTSNNTTTNGQSSSSSLQENQIDAILQVAGGDMRRAVTSLQSVHALLSGTTTPNGDDPSTSTSSSSSTTIVVNEALIAELSGLPPDSVIDELYRSFTAPSYDTMAQSVHDCIISNGYSVQTVLQKLLMKITTPPPTLFDDGDGEDGLLLLLLDELGRSRLAIRIAEAEYKMNEGADEYLQLMTVCGLAMQCIQEARRKNSGTRTTVTN